MPQKGRRYRPLGIVQRSNNASEEEFKLPMLRSSTESMDRALRGIHGYALAIPPAPIKVSREEPVPAKSHQVPRPNTASRAGDTSACLEVKKQLAESLVRGKRLKAELDALQKVNAEIRSELDAKHRESMLLVEQVANLMGQDMNYKNLYEEEVLIHEDTKQRLASMKEALLTRDQQFYQLNAAHKESIKELEIQMEKEISEMKKEKDEEISEKEQKLTRLKHQMADILSGNSLERQRQLEELSKELTRTQDEADMLRTQLRSIAKSNMKYAVPGCTGCEALGAKIHHLSQLISKKDKIIQELQHLAKSLRSS